MSLSDYDEVIRYMEDLDFRVKRIEEAIGINITSLVDVQSTKRTYTTQSKEKIKNTQIHSYEDRQKRKTEKRGLILTFLESHTWTIADIVRKLINVKSIQAANKTLESMKKDGLVKDFEYKNGSSRLHRVWGITRQGLVYASAENESESVSKSFEPSKVSIQSIPHTIDIQYMSLVAQGLGYTGWVNGSYFGFKRKLMRIPDAIAVSSDDVRIAFEIERTVKSTKRYREIMLSHLVEITKNKRWDKVIYLCPDEQLVTRISKIFSGLGYVIFRGEKIKITSKHLNYFIFITYEDFDGFVK